MVMKLSERFRLNRKNVRLNQEREEEMVVTIKQINEKQKNRRNMEDRVMQLTGCNRMIAGQVVREVQENRSGYQANLRSPHTLI